MNCSSCQSDQTQRVELIYQQGTSNINTRSNTSGVGIGSGGGIGFASAHTKTTGTQQTALAKRLAPPGHFIGRLALAGCLVLLLLTILTLNDSMNKFFGMLIVTAGLIGSIACLVYGAYWERAVRRPKYSVWQKTWHCNRCGALYKEPGADDAFVESAPKRRMWAQRTAILAGVCFVIVISGVVSNIGSSAASAEQAHAQAMIGSELPQPQKTKSTKNSAKKQN